VWTITSGQPALSAHVLVAPDGDCHAVRRDLEQLLSHDYEVDHTTLQVDHVPDQVFTLTGTDRKSSDGTHCEDPHGPVHRDEPHPH
jgi:cobalt-zinc-cadmium efflux system protein